MSTFPSIPVLGRPPESALSSNSDLSKVSNTETLPFPATNGVSMSTLPETNKLDVKDQVGQETAKMGLQKDASIERAGKGSGDPKRELKPIKNVSDADLDPTKQFQRSKETSKSIPDPRSHQTGIETSGFKGKELSTAPQTNIETKNYSNLAMTNPIALPEVEEIPAELSNGLVEDDPLARLSLELQIFENLPESDANNIENMTEEDFEDYYNLNLHEEIGELGESVNKKSCCNSLIKTYSRLCCCTCLGDVDQPNSIVAKASLCMSCQNTDPNYTPLLQIAAKKGAKLFVKYLKRIFAKELLESIFAKKLLLKYIFKLTLFVYLLAETIISCIDIAEDVQNSKSVGFDVAIFIVSLLGAIIETLDLSVSFWEDRMKIKTKCCTKKKSKDALSEAEKGVSKDNNDSMENKEEVEVETDKAKGCCCTSWLYFCKYSEITVVFVAEVFLYAEIILNLFTFICDETFKSFRGINVDGHGSFSFTFGLLTFVITVYLFRPLVLGYQILVLHRQQQKERAQIKTFSCLIPEKFKKVLNFQVWLIIHIFGMIFFHAFLLLTIGWKIAYENCDYPPGATGYLDLSCSRPAFFSFFTFYNILYGIAAPWLSFFGFLIANISWTREFSIKLYINSLLKSKEIATEFAKDTAVRTFKKGKKGFKTLVKFLKKRRKKDKKQKRKEKEDEILKEFLKEEKENNESKKKVIIEYLNKFLPDFKAYEEQNLCKKAWTAVLYGPTILYCVVYVLLFIINLVFLGCRVDSSTGENVCSGNSSISIFDSSSVTSAATEFGVIVFCAVILFNCVNVQSFGIGIGWIIVLTIIFGITVTVAITIISILCFLKFIQMLSANFVIA